MKCELCKTNIGIVKTFIGSICMDCDLKTTKLAEEKLKTWKLPRFEETIYCPMCEIEHANNSLCQRPTEEEYHGDHV